MRIAFRTDASIQIGTGHVMRCLTLAAELRRQGHECVFVCREHEGHLGDLISQKGFTLHLLAKTDAQQQPDINESQLAHADWLGASWQKDAKETSALLHDQRPDWLVVDHYALDAKWERIVAQEVGQIMVIDDLADREHECAVLLDQNVLDGDGEQQYCTRVNEECSLLLGPKYALLRPEYGVLAEALPPRDGGIDRVLIFVGGSDPYHLTELYLKALNGPQFIHLSVDVVIGKNHPSPAAVENLVAQRVKTRLYSGLPSLSGLMVRADLMLGAGGSTNWERICLGLNAIVISMAANQDYVNQELLNNGLIHFLGKAEDVTLEAISSTLKHLIEDPLMNETRAIKMRAIADGQGCQRVVDTLSEWTGL